jgi:hypothetical protein
LKQVRSCDRLDWRPHGDRDYFVDLDGECA